MKRFEVGDLITGAVRYNGMIVVAVSTGWYRAYYPTKLRHCSIEEATTSIRSSWVHE